MRAEDIQRTLTGVCSHLIDKGKLPIITIYYNTPDRPGLYTARVYSVGAGKATPTKIAYSHPLISHLRQALPEGMTKLHRDTNDDKTVIESWI